MGDQRAFHQFVEQRLQAQLVALHQRAAGVPGQLLHQTLAEQLPALVDKLPLPLVAGQNQYQHRPDAEHCRQCGGLAGQRQRQEALVKAVEQGHLVGQSGHCL